MGTRVKFSNGRRLVDDVVTLAQKFPSAGLSGEFDAPQVHEIRRISRPRISWNVLYMKAYAEVAAETPELRQCYVRFPRPHLYQHHDVVCMLTLSRKHEGQERLFFARFNNPQEDGLDELQQRYDYLRQAPVEEIKQFRHQIRFASMPRFLRRCGWWVMFNLWPAKRSSHIGTMAMSLSGYKGSFGTRHLGPLTSILGTDPVPRKGKSHLTLTFDHRVLDGVPATRILNQIQKRLTTTVAEELAKLVVAESQKRLGVERRGEMSQKCLAP